MEADVHVVRRYDASPERVFAAWLDAETAGCWLFATASEPIVEVDIDARVGGGFRFVERRRGRVIEHAGRYLEIRWPRRLAFSLTNNCELQHPTRVTIDIGRLRNGCELALSHARVQREDYERAEGRWTGILYGLSVTLDAATHRSNQTRSRR